MAVRSHRGQREKNKAVQANGRKWWVRATTQGSTTPFALNPPYAVASRTCRDATRARLTLVAIGHMIPGNNKIARGAGQQQW
ncbi:MAG: hypothetical protein HY673_07640 [Chloroflexi bacterium]|nr:hypothetical protein [Chloroflexota bacterium]